MRICFKHGRIKDNQKHCLLYCPSSIMTQIKVKTWRAKLLFGLYTKDFDADDENYHCLMPSLTLMITCSHCEIIDFSTFFIYFFNGGKIIL